MEQALEGRTIDDASVRRRSLRRAAVLTATVGIAFSVLYIVAILLLAGVPGPSATDAQIVAYYRSPSASTSVTVGLYLMPFAGMAFLWFVVALRMWASNSVRTQSELFSGLQFVSGIAFVLLTFVGAAAGAVLAVTVQLAGGFVDPSVARQFPVFGNTVHLYFAMRVAAMFVFTTSSIGRSTGILPRWFGFVGIGVGLLLLLSATFTPVLVLVFPAWVLVACSILLYTARGIPGDLVLVTLRGRRTYTVEVAPDGIETASGSDPLTPRDGAPASGIGIAPPTRLD
ncbi:MAG: hypothetical protein ACJ77N_03360 [Chloroflexota bacterium]|jgi:hypothetical protein